MLYNPKSFYLIFFFVCCSLYHYDIGMKAAVRLAAVIASSAAFSEGDRVSHMTFGEGEIISVKPMGADVLYEISFDKVGTKKLMATYAKLKKLN